MKQVHKERVGELAPCGVYCGACPSFGKSCYGCGSSEAQKRKSKFSCKIRKCCYEEKDLNYCADCEDFPCKLINKKLINSHLSDPRFTYRHEVAEIFPKLKDMSLDEFLEFQKERWKCKFCDGTVWFYAYKCNSCGKEQLVK